jgi:dihydroneopterin aldolase
MNPAFRDAIRIRNLQVDCVVGVHPRERDTPQPLLVDSEMRLDTERAGAEERLHASVDYSAVAAQVAFLLRSCRFRMLETAARVLCRYLLLPPPPGERRAQLESARIGLSKPGALPGTAVPALEIERGAEWAVLKSERRSFGAVDIVHETREAGIYRLNLAPGATIPTHIHRKMRESEMVLGEGLLCQGKPVPAGTVNFWPKVTPHGYHNPTGRSQTILCVDCPPFADDDEIVVDR